MYLLNTFLASFTLSQNVSQQTSKLRFAVNDIITRRAILAHVILSIFAVQKIPPDGLRNYFPFELELPNNPTFLMSATTENKDGQP